jgi:hypothetical protein
MLAWAPALDPTVGEMRRSTILALAAILFPLACLPLSLSLKRSNFADDEKTYYLPSIARISAHWPAVDFAGDSTSATSPGYCYMLAGIARVTGPRLRMFRLITVGMSTVVLLLLCSMFPPKQGLAAAVAILPLAASNFFIKSASWVVTDNAALVFVCLALICVLRCNRNVAWAFPAGLAATAAMFTRQLHAWLVAPIAWAALTAGGARGGPTPLRSRVLALSALLPPLALLYWLRRSWGGFVPQAWQKLHSSGIHPACAACALTVFAVLGIFYFLSVDPAASLLRLARGREALFGAAVGGLVATISKNGMDREAARWGGYFWAIVERAPTLAGRSIPIVAFSILGGGLMGAMTIRLRESSGPAKASVWLVSVASWVGACMLNPLAFQRYFEPPVLVFLVVWLALQLKDPPAGTPAALRFRPLLVLTAVQVVITVFTTYIPVLSGD